MLLVTYSALGPDKLAIQMPSILVKILHAARTLHEPGTALVGPGPLAVAHPDLVARDPLADLEAQFAAEDLAAAVKASRDAQEALATTLLSAATSAGLVVALTTEQLLMLSGWANRLYIATRLDVETVTVGQAQDAFDDSGLAALLGIETPEPELEIGLLPAVLATFSTELLEVHRQMLTAFA